MPLRQRKRGIRLVEVMMVGLLVLWPTCGWSVPDESAAIADEVLQRLVAPAMADEPPALTDRLHQLLMDASAILADMDLEARRIPLSAHVQDQALAEAHQRFGTLRTAFRALQAEVRAQVKATRAQLSALHVPDQTAAWDARAAQVEKQFAQLLDVLDTLPATLHTPSRRRALEKIRALVDRLRDAMQQRSIGPTLVPQPTFQQEIPPTQAPDTVTAPSAPALQAVTPVADLTEPPALRAVAAPAAAAAVAAVPPPALPSAAAACGYSTADLDQGATAPSEVRITQEMRDIVAALNYSPVAIYQHVASTIRFEPYYGSLKGAAGTLISQAGNATDHASLLVALLRAANIPARYVKGTVSMIQDPRLLRWPRLLPWRSLMLSCSVSPSLSKVRRPATRLPWMPGSVM